MAMDFIAIDFETANYQQCSPCALGVTLVKNNQITNTNEYLINPKQRFLKRNIEIHGITAEMVKDCPEFSSVIHEILPFINHYPIVAHNASFDKSVLEKTAAKYHIALPNLTFYCTLEITKYNYPQLDSYSLDNLCQYFNICLDHHHNCSEDSMAAAKILIKLLNDETTNIFAYNKFSVNYNQINESTSHTNNSNYSKFLAEPDYENSSVKFDELDCIEFNEKTFVITGDFENYSRAELKNIIKQKGGVCTSSVSKNVDYLVVGMQNKNLIKDTVGVKSTKILKAEKLRSNGAKIKIVPGKLLKSYLEVQNV